MSIHPAPVLLLLALLCAGCGLRGGNFPSLAPRAAETPRAITEPGAAVVPGLSTEEQEGLAQDLARERKRFSQTQQEVAAAARALTAALAVPGVSQPGSAPWSNAQMQLSRFDLARAPFDSIDMQLVPLQRLTGDLPAEDANRKAVDQLAAQIASETAAAQKLADNAARRLAT